MVELVYIKSCAQSETDCPRNTSSGTPHAKSKAACPFDRAMGFFCQPFWLGISTLRAQVFTCSTWCLSQLSFWRGLELWKKNAKFLHVPHLNMSFYFCNNDRDHVKLRFHAWLHGAVAALITSNDVSIQIVTVHQQVTEQLPRHTYSFFPSSWMLDLDLNCTKVQDRPIAIHTPI